MFSTTPKAFFNRYILKASESKIQFFLIMVYNGYVNLQLLGQSGSLSYYAMTNNLKVDIIDSQSFSIIFENRVTIFFS